MDIVSYSQYEEDPFEKVDIRMEMQEMIDATLTDIDGCELVMQSNSVEVMWVTTGK